jgi:CBS domain-containing protein
VGLITPHEVRNLDRARWPFLTVRDAMRPIDEVHSLPPDAPATQALEMMGRQDVNQIPIVLGGQLQGIVTRAHLLQMIHSRSELLGRS